jgi:hypothetical protein
MFDRFAKARVVLLGEASHGHFGILPRPGADYPPADRTARLSRRFRLVDLSFVACARELTQSNRHCLRLRIVKDAELRRRARRHCGNCPHEVARTLHSFVVHRGNDIAGFDPCLRRRAVALDFSNNCADRILEPNCLGKHRGDRLNLHAEPASRDVSLILELPDDECDGFGWNSKCNADYPPEGETIAVLTPITSPLTLKVGPPEFPSFTGASI